MRRTNIRGTTHIAQTRHSRLNQSLAPLTLRLRATLTRRQTTCSSCLLGSHRISDPPLPPHTYRGSLKRSLGSLSVLAFFIQ